MTIPRQPEGRQPTGRQPDGRQPSIDESAAAIAAPPTVTVRVRGLSSAPVRVRNANAQVVSA